MDQVNMTPAEYQPYDLPDPQFFIDLLPKEFTGSDLVALGFVLPEYSNSATLSEILKNYAEQEQESDEKPLIATADGDRMVPFVAALVPTVDLAAGYLQLADVGGFLADPPEEN